jgi:hypothetical protein
MLTARQFMKVTVEQGALAYEFGVGGDGPGVQWRHVWVSPTSNLLALRRLKETR